MKKIASLLRYAHLTPQLLYKASHLFISASPAEESTALYSVLKGMTLINYLKQLEGVLA